MSSEMVFLISAAAAAAAVIILDYYHTDGTPYYGDGGQATYVRFVLNQARPDLFREIAGLHRRTFDQLVLEFREAGLLEDGRSVTVEEQVLMFLDIIRYNNSMRQTALKFRPALHTANRYFEDVLEPLFERYPKYGKYDKTTTLFPDRLRKNGKYKAFNKCLGALDGVLVPAHAPLKEQSSWRSRKRFIAQNILAAVNFEFVFVLAGWEGSAHDTGVLTDARSKGFNIPEKFYFLADAGYGVQKGLMTPYRAVRYHLKEQAAAELRPANSKELYNLRHASLRNVVERLFGVVKKNHDSQGSTGIEA